MMVHSMRLPRIRLKVWMLLVAAALPALILAYYVDAKKRAEHRRTLELFGAIGSRGDFLSAEGWRAYLERCRLAEAYLGITPRHFEKGAALWTEEDERRYAEKLYQSGADLEGIYKEIEALDNERSPRVPSAGGARDPARDGIESPRVGPAPTGPEREILESEPLLP